VGDKEREPFQQSFNGFLNVDFQGSRVTSDGGFPLIREFDERLNRGGTRSDVAQTAENRCNGGHVRLPYMRRNGQNGNPGSRP